LSKTILITGAGGFIGFHLASKLVGLGFTVIGLDNLNDYYDVNLKLSRLRELGIENDLKSKIENQSSLHSNFVFYKGDITDKIFIDDLFSKHKFEIVVNLAAQAGVRHSIDHPEAYIQSNIIGHFNILEACRNGKIDHLIYASSSSVYGDSSSMPLSENDRVDKPISLYAATKVSNELMTHSYAHLYGLKATGLRFFTVYGPWGRPDMAVFLFTDAIINGKPIKIFNNGNLERDFTYIDDIISGIEKVINHGPKNNDDFYHKVFNIGNSSPTKLDTFIRILEKVIGTEAEKQYLPMQAGDVHKTFADVSKLQLEFGYAPNTSLEEGLGSFYKWYKTYFI
jgi:UDP-glucuronate 4-epimerase